MYANWLANEFVVKKTYTGQSALDQLTDSIDVVLLDRDIPDLSGSEVLEAIRERQLPCRVCMVSGVKPDFDIIDMGFDEYLLKPVDPEELLATAKRCYRLSAFEKELQELFALATTKAILEDQKTSLELQRSQEYAELLRELESQRDRADDLIKQLDEEEVATLFRDFNHRPMTNGV